MTRAGINSRVRRLEQSRPEADPPGPLPIQVTDMILRAAEEGRELTEDERGRVDFYSETIEQIVRRVCDLSNVSANDLAPPRYRTRPAWSTLGRETLRTSLGLSELTAQSRTRRIRPPFRIFQGSVREGRMVS